jgi:hypothetical protein
MNKKMTAILILSLCSSMGYADICPSVAEIKQHSMHGWKIYDSEENTLLSAQRLEKFKAHIKTFALAEWGYQNNKTRAIHCYYLDKDGSTMEAFVAKDNFSPDRSPIYWY